MILQLVGTDALFSSMPLPKAILSKIIHYMKYAKYLNEWQRRESRMETVIRNRDMHIRRFPHVKDEIIEAFEYVARGDVLPSMRGFQFAGKAIENKENRIYNCLAPETRFITDKGVKSFLDFEDGDQVKILTHAGRWKSATVREYGKQWLNKITMRRCRSEKTIFATENHRWILRDGSTTTSLSKGDLLHPINAEVRFNYDTAEPFEKLYWCYGYVFGDGTKVNNSSGSYSMVRLCDKDDKFKIRFEEMGFKTSTSHSLNGDFMAYTGKYAKTAPDPENDPPEMIRAFLAGYLDADAEKNPNHYKDPSYCPYRTIQTSSKEHFEFLKLCLESCGYFVSNIEDLNGQETNFGKRGPTWRFFINDRIGLRPQSSWSVYAIEPTERNEQVWCLEVEDDRSFVLSGGIVTGNCAFAAINGVECFRDLLYNLMCGSGVGYSVQRAHTNQLSHPLGYDTSQPPEEVIIADTIEGWCDAYDRAIRGYLLGWRRPDYKYHLIRSQGSLLQTSGGRAPGPGPLRVCLERTLALLDAHDLAYKIQPWECSDLCCFGAEATHSGGIRRAAMIGIFDWDDIQMLGYKSGHAWHADAPYRGFVNISAAMDRKRRSKLDFLDFWQYVTENGSGDPGVYWMNDLFGGGPNPCVEKWLLSRQFCNLVTINGATIRTLNQLIKRSIAAARIATLQASYTNFNYLSPEWAENTAREALLGVSITGIAEGRLGRLNIRAAAEAVVAENKRFAAKIGINPAARTTCIKPEGTGSLVLGAPCGVHGWDYAHYIKNVRMGKDEPIYGYLKSKLPELVEDLLIKVGDEWVGSETHAVFRAPVKATLGSVIAEYEDPIHLLERVKWLHKEWIVPGHKDGSNTNNVSCTVYAETKNDWERIGDWLFENKGHYNGVAVFPHFSSTHKQLPHSKCTKAEYDEAVSLLKQIDLTEIREETDLTNLQGAQACAGGFCAT